MERYLAAQTDRLDSVEVSTYEGAVEIWNNDSRRVERSDGCDR